MSKSLKGYVGNHAVLAGLIVLGGNDLSEPRRDEDAHAHQQVEPTVGYGEQCTGRLDEVVARGKLRRD